MPLTAKIPNIQAVLERLRTLTSVEPQEMSIRTTSTYLVPPTSEQESLAVKLTRHSTSSPTAIFTRYDISDQNAVSSVTAVVPHADKFEDILLDSGYVYDALVDQIRDSFKYKNHLIHIDNVRELGYFVRLQPVAAEATPEAQLVGCKQILSELMISESNLLSPTEDYDTLIKEITA